jgi:hypothetical protein
MAIRNATTGIWRAEVDDLDLRFLTGRITSEPGTTTARVLFVVRYHEIAKDSWGPGSLPALEAIKGRFGDEVVEDMVVSGWPGTELTKDGLARVFILPFDSGILSRMASVEPMVFNWLHSKGLPEDMCLFEDGTSLPWLITVTHERIAWFLSPARPDFPLAFAQDRGPLDAYVFKGKYCCRERTDVTRLKGDKRVATRGKPQ